MRRQLSLVAPPIVIAAAIFFLSAQPHLPGPEIPHLDKVSHATAFGTLAFLIIRALLGRGRPLHSALLWGVVLTVLYGISDEVHQAFVPGRSPDARDLVADTAGALIAAAVWKHLQRGT